MEPTGIEVDFLQRALHDLEGVGLSPLETYQALYPGFEDVIARVYADLAPVPTSPMERAQPKDPVAAFEGAWIADRASRRQRSLSAYLALFPGDQAGVLARHAELLSEDGGEPVPSAPESGTWVGQYRLLEEIGRGGQGRVYKAVDTRINRIVALKLLHPHQALSSEVVRRFQREAEIAGRLDDPSIASVYEAGVTEGQAFMVMPCVPGRTLAHFLSEARTKTRREEGTSAETTTTKTTLETHGDSGPFGEIGDVVALMEEIARAMHRAHEKGVVHRDLKPSNVMLTPEGRAVILDFGLASAETFDLTSLTRTGDVQGTLPYMSPEQVNGETHRIDRRTDVYALGATLFELLTLRRPFEAPTREALCRAIEIEEPRPLRALVPRCGRDLEVVVATALAKDPDRRYATAQDMADDLRRVRVHEPIAARPPAAWERIWLWARRRPARAALVILAVIGIPVVAGLTGFLVANLPAIADDHARKARARVDRILESAYRELGEGSRSKAKEGFRQALDLDPGREEALGGIILAELYGGRLEAADGWMDSHGHQVGATVLGILRNLVAQKRESKTGPWELPPTDGSGSPLEAYLVGSFHLHLAHMEADGRRFYERAYELISRAVLTAPEQPAFWYFDLAHAVGHLADRRLAEPLDASLLTLWPESYAALYWAGFLWRNVDAERALDLFQRSAALDPGFGPCWSNIGWLLLELDRPKDAEGPIRAALAQDPENAQLRQYLGDLLTRQGRFVEALEELERALDADPSALLPRLDVVRCLIGLGRFDEAESILHQCLEAHPNDAVARLLLVGLLGRQDRIDEALDQVERVLASNPDNNDGLRFLASCWLRKGDWSKVADARERRLKLYPDDEGQRKDTAHAFMKAGRAPEGIATLEEGLASRPESNVLWFSLGTLHDRADDLVSAATAFRRAAEADPDHAEAWCKLGQVLKAQGKFDEAVEALRRGHDLGRARGEAWTYPSAKWLAEAEEAAREASRDNRPPK